MPDTDICAPALFVDPDRTADGSPRAHVAFAGLDTLWVNIGTLCNIECAHCYIESSPTNDRLVYLTADDLAPFLAEARVMGGREIGFTGGEPFMNPAMPDMLDAALEAGFSALVLTNAMAPMMRPRVRDRLVETHKRYGDRLRLRISLDHFTPALHDAERGDGAFDKTMAGLCWLRDQGFILSVAGRTRWDETEEQARDGFAALFAAHDLSIDARDPSALVLFPEMDETAPVPEITEACWDILGKRPEDMMCASARMLVKRKGAAAPALTACTLLAYDPRFEMGASLAESTAPVSLNHPHCAKFCVLGGASCSG